MADNEQLIRERNRALLARVGEDGPGIPLAAIPAKPTNKKRAP